MAITTEMVKELRGVTGAGVLEAKKALEQTDGNFDKAVDILREKGAARALKRADRTAKEMCIRDSDQRANDLRRHALSDR